MWICFDRADADVEEGSPTNEVSLFGRRADGGTFPIEATFSPTILGERCLFTGIVRDVSRRRQLESQLAHALKMESVGQLAAGVAHEINSPIQFIGDNLRFLQEAFVGWRLLLKKNHELIAKCERHGQLEAEVLAIQETMYDQDIAFSENEIPFAIEQALEGTQRVARIVGAMREFSHPGGRQSHDVDLNAAVRNTVVVTRNEWKYVAELETSLDPDLPLVPCFANEINQVLLNLVVNAAHAIAERVKDSGSKGRIRISTQLVGEDVLVSVSDTGVGIPASIQRRIFDPFFTTKPVGKGTGQGLAIVYSVVVEQHGGSIDLESSPEARNHVFVATACSSPPSTTNAGRLMKRRLLFVDDDRFVLAGLRRLLNSERRSWDVQFASGGEEALELISNSNIRRNHL